MLAWIECWSKDTHSTAPEMMTRVLLILLVVALGGIERGVEGFRSARHFVVPRVSPLRAGVLEVEEVEEEEEVVMPRKYVAVFSTAALNITASPFGGKVASREEAKRELLQMLVEDKSGGEDFSRFRIDYLVKYLESTHAPIHTAPFLSLALGGAWQCIYTNALLSRADPTLLTTIVQEVMPATNNTGGVISNKIQWRLEREGDAGRGELRVNSIYTLTPQGALSVSLLEHVLDIDTPPLSSEAVVMDLQRSIPFQFFDPDDSSIQVTYVDPDVRVSRISGPIFVNLFEIHLRLASSSGGSAPDAQERRHQIV